GFLWQADLTNSDAMFRQGLTSRIITAKHAARAMMPARRGLIVEVTENDIVGAGANPIAHAVKNDPNFLVSESPLFVGRAIAALAADPDVRARTGLLHSSWELAHASGST